MPSVPKHLPERSEGVDLATVVVMVRYPPNGITAYGSSSG